MLSRLLRNIVVMSIAGALFSAPAFALRINIPRMHLKSVVNYTSQDIGPRLYYQDRNTVAIAGHRVTPWTRHGWPYGAFYAIDRLRIGDFIYLRDNNYINVYRVTHRYLHILPSHVREFTKRAGLILSACTPKHFATYRFVVQAKLVNVIHT